jgi:hypothetical protein
MTATPEQSRRLGNNRGSAIMLVVSFGALVTLLVFTWVVFSVKRYHVSIERRDGLRARYAAESVISQVIYEKMVNPGDSLKRNDTGVMLQPTPDSTMTDDPLPYTDSLHNSSATAMVEEEGSYFRVKAEGRAGTGDCTIDALFGIELPPEYRFALILAGICSDNTPLQIRRGKIIGDVQLPKGVNGPITGKVEKGAGKPPVNPDKFAAEIREFDKKLDIGDSAETVLPTTQTFTDKKPPPVCKDKDLFVNGNILIESRSRIPFVVSGPGTIIATGNIQISGTVVIDNVEILALGNVQCFDNARLQNVTLYSRQMIGFGDKVTVSGNLYAKESIVLAGQATVEMPTFAFTKDNPSKKDGNKNCGLQLTQQSRFSGTFFCNGALTTSLIERDARFTGLFYSMGYLILEGTVFGCVAAASLTENIDDAGTTNILAGGTINRKILPKNFIVPCAFGQAGTAYRLVSWTMSSPGKKPKGGAE